MTSLELNKQLGYCVNGSDFIFDDIQYIEGKSYENYFFMIKMIIRNQNQ